ncbi:MAG: (d)CMP kinase [Hydrotalea flava]|uniref:(d)CMP kinase n=1 Tax=Hydrotalea TaxID=1004300 RepID=UPI000945DA62|nr:MULTISPECIES: (d)CMP kinase [Hydrotalea]MBY0349134.1 (d)CMP kinase [Hydrotalea flava]NIM33894.1 (d)CMP kinase [Hydrotalea flava]NIM36723.1 (d)CMP kinase [Hydrotalea flava]NIN01909.1 (d)CMP kinase [Hydrotalea flava]NIN13567.1 (d)CMP kinase [Hydrotalea flava]
MKKIIIAIDGYSSCGKSTLAKALAKKLHYVFIDSGAMYRAITLYFIQHKIKTNHENEVAEALKHIHLAFEFHPETEQNNMLLNGINVEAEIRNMAVSAKVSEVAAIPAVRKFAVAQQQQMGRLKGIVMDGRDIGTTVFPQAELKIFVTADPAIRVERRFKELFAQNKNITIEDVKANLEMRDYIDTNRTESPLRKANDAKELNNSNLTKEEQLNIAYKWAMETTHQK